MALISVVFAYADCWFSHEAAHLLNLANEHTSVYIYKQENKSRVTLSQPGSLVFK